jgi:hypothetical protein
MLVLVGLEATMARIKLIRRMVLLEEVAEAVVLDVINPEEL